MNDLLHFYAYVYLDPRKPGKFKYGEYEFNYEPFYVGKGQGNRLEKHLKEYFQKFDNNKSKINKIKNIEKNGFKVLVIKYQEKLFEQDALDLETKMIKTIGRIDLGTGPLTNLTDGGDGSSGYVHKKEDIIRMSKLKKGISLTEKHKKNISKATSGRLNPMYGVHNTGDKSFWFGKKLSKEHIEKLKISHEGLQTGTKHPMNKYIYFISDESNFWDLDKKIRVKIMKLFSKKKTNQLEFNGITIIRKLKSL